MNYLTRKHKYNGWISEKKITTDNKQIDITIEQYQTNNESKKIIAYVTVGILNSENGYNFITHRIFTDYSKRFMILDNVKMVTSKKIAEATEIFIKESESLVLEEIKQFYLKLESVVKNEIL